MKVNLQGKESITVINVYAPSSVEVEKVENFYDIERATADSDSKWKIIAGEF